MRSVMMRNRSLSVNNFLIKVHRPEGIIESLDNNSRAKLAAEKSDGKTEANESIFQDVKKLTNKVTVNQRRPVNRLTTVKCTPVIRQKCISLPNRNSSWINKILLL
jgi:hypothetical protein